MAILIDVCFVNCGDFQTESRAHLRAVSNIWFDDSIKEFAEAAEFESWVDAMELDFSQPLTSAQLQALRRGGCNCDGPPSVENMTSAGPGQQEL